MTSFIIGNEPLLLLLLLSLGLGWVVLLLVKVGVVVIIDLLEDDFLVGVGGAVDGVLGVGGLL